jgi:hypothetical protein
MFPRHVTRGGVTWPRSTAKHPCTTNANAVMIKLLWKESINSDDQQFHRYLQYEQQPLTSNHWTFDIGNPGPCSGNEQNDGEVLPVNGISTTLKIQILSWDMNKTVAGLNGLMRYQLPSPEKQQTIKKTCTHSLLLRKKHTITKMST